MTTYLLGDSHLARVVRDLPRLGQNVANLAIGGAVVDDLAGQLARVGPATTDWLVLSVGTNDADPTRGRPLPEFRARLSGAIASRPHARWLYVASPGCRGDRILSDWTAERIAAYADTAADVTLAAGGAVVATPAVLAAAGDAAFDPDGLHLSGTGYDLLLPAIAAALEASS